MLADIYELEREKQEKPVLKYTPEEAFKRQQAYCAEKGYPFFAEMRWCSCNVFAEPWTNEHSGDTLITGCKFCNRSFVE